MTKHNETIKIASWNVNSWTNCNCEVRIEILKQIDADIIFINETKLKGNDKLNLPNYKWFGFNRKNQLKKARSGSGGVGIFLKCNILDEWNFSEIDRNMDGLYVVCLTHKINDFKLVLNPCYLPPENSSWGMESDAYFNHLISTLYSIEDIDLFIGGGDINARIGHNNDFIVDVDTLPNREVLDSVTNAHGDMFIDFLLSCKMCVLNGRVEGENSFTSISQRGRSVVDYFFSHIDSLDHFKHMYVKSCKDILHDISFIPHNSVPDHSVLILDVDISDFNLQRDTSKSDNLKLNEFRKQYNVSTIPEDFMIHGDVVDDLICFSNSIQSAVPSQESADQIYSQFVEVHNKELERKVVKIDSNISHRPKRQKKSPFWDENLAFLYKEAAKAEKEFVKCNSSNLNEKRSKLSNFKQKQAIFDKCFRYAKRKYNRDKELEIENMVNKDGKSMWQYLENIGPNVKQKPIPLEVVKNGVISHDMNDVNNLWTKEFASLYCGLPADVTSDENNSVDLAHIGMPVNPEYVVYDSCELNEPITRSEVEFVIQNLKNGKAVSVDRLPNEVYKNSNSIDMLLKLYNFCYNNSVVPEVWRRALISPIYKGKNKDRREPLSYRPISLICNSCKGFSYILNKRLLNYLEKNNILVEEQNGFRKNRSCQDHVFLLHTLVDARLSQKKSVFGCFVDFSSAFDFLNRDLLHYKLKRIGIRGRFLNIIKCLNTGTKCSIKLNDKVTDWFETKAGVRQGQNDSPTLFAIYLNDLAQDIKGLGKGVQIGEVQICILLYADDIVLLAENECDMQLMLNTLNEWCKKWRMVINYEKTQIIHFRPKRKLLTTNEFKLGNAILKFVSSYRYLGCTINENLDRKGLGKAVI